MKYMLMIYGDPAHDTKMTPEDIQEEMAQYNAFGTMLEKRGTTYTGEALMPVNTATTVRVREGKTLTTDGPFAETHEVLGGFYLVDANDLDDAIAIAAQIPGAKNGSIEIRPVVVFE